MKFNRLERFLIRLFALDKDEFSNRWFKKIIAWKRNLTLHLKKASSKSDSLNDYQKEPIDNKKGLGQKKTGNKRDDAKIIKRIAKYLIILVIIGALIALLVLGGKTFSTTPLNVSNITSLNATTYQFTLFDGSTRTFSTSNRPTLFRNPSNDVEVIYGTSAYNSQSISTVFVPNNNVIITVGTQQTDTTTTSSTTTNGNNTQRLVQSYFLVANLIILRDGRVFNSNLVGKKGDQILFFNSFSTTFTNGSSANGNATPYVFDSNLSNNFGLIFRNAFTNTRPIPFNFTYITTTIFNLLPFIILISVFYWVFKKSSAMSGLSGGDNVFSMGKSQAKLAKSNVLFSDVAGIHEEKNELIEIVDYLRRPERYVAMGARVPKGVILYGPPGTGKTLLAKAVAGEAKVPFFQVSGSAFEDMLVGVGAKRVRDLFAKAIKAAPAIVFIDEIDSVGSKRGKFETTAGSLADQTLNQLLAEMDGFNTRTGVIVMAATNRLDVLDEALLRPGRFDRHIQVTLPDIKERVAILKIHSRNKNISTQVDLEDIARRTPGFSGAQLENVLNEATLLAVRRNKKSISTIDLDEAIDRVIAGPAKKSRVISLEEKRQIAYHEAGHAIVGLFTKGSDVVEKITIIPRGQAAGYTLSVPKIQELSIKKKSDLLGMIGGLLGGRAAEEFVFGKDHISTGAANDFYKATNIVRAMVTQLGMTDVGMAQYYPSEGTVNPYQTKLFSEKTAQAIDAEIENIFQERYQYAYNIIKNNRLELDLIVESLLILETIVKNQIDYIHKYKKLPQEAINKKLELEQKHKAAQFIKDIKNDDDNNQTQNS